MIQRLYSLKLRLYYALIYYFWWWARLSLRRWNPRVVIVTGSVGKTTLLNLLELQLSDDVHYSHNFNSGFGLALDILHLEGVRGSRLRWLYLLIAVPVRALLYTRRTTWYVAELDGDRPGEAEFVAGQLQPEVCLWVSLGRTHPGKFDGVVAKGKFSTVDEAINAEFASIPAATQKLVIYDATNATMSAIMQTCTTPSIGVHPQVQDYAVSPQTTTITVDQQTYTFTYPMPEEIAEQLAMTREFAKYLDLQPITDMTGYQQPPGRSTALRGIHDTWLIDSTYNAHLMSIEALLQLVLAMKTPGEKWVVLGDMVEQGKSEQREHESLGALLQPMPYDRIILVGRRLQQYTYVKLDPAKTVTFLRPLDALKYLQGELRGNETTILFKGSQYLEGIIEQLLVDPSDALELPRREAAAVRRRQKQGGLPA